MTLQEAEVWVAEQIISFYHTAWHDTLQMSVGKAWELAHTTEDGLVLPVVVTDERELLLSFLPFKARVISPNGIHLFGLRYWAGELSQYVGARHKFRVKYDARNISRVFVEVDDDIYVDVPFADPSQEALPLFEHQHRRREARRCHREDFDHDARHAAMARREERRRRSKRSTQECRREERIRQSLAATATSHQAPAPSSASVSSEAGPNGRVDYRREPVINWDDGDV
jgi:putative transposase